jgi:hypothetical protein
MIGFIDYPLACIGHRFGKFVIRPDHSILGPTERVFSTRPMDKRRYFYPPSDRMIVSAREIKSGSRMENFIASDPPHQDQYDDYD